jgi:hypothetical protein
VLSRLPFLKFLAVAQVARLAGRHYGHLNAKERRRLNALLLKGVKTTPSERRELRDLVEKIDLRGLAGGTASRLSPIPLPKRLTGARY